MDVQNKSIELWQTFKLHHMRQIQQGLHYQVGAMGHTMDIPHQMRSIIVMDLFYDTSIGALKKH